MTPRLLAAALGGAGGLLLVLAGGLSFLTHDSSGWRGAVAVLGYAATVAALVLVGYGLVSQAPVWLRAIVSIAFPLLIASVWQVVDQAFEDGIGGWKAPATSHLLGGVIVLAVALIDFRRAGADRARSYEPTHR